jgi:cytochrome P450
MGAIGKVLVLDVHRFIERMFFRAISRDPIAFPDPETFDPQRWIDSEGRVKDNIKFIAYGFGRR